MVPVDWLGSGKILWLVVLIDRRSKLFLNFVFDSRKELQRKPVEDSKVFSIRYSRKQSANQRDNTSGPCFSTKTHTQVVYDAPRFPYWWGGISLTCGRNKLSR